MVLPGRAGHGGDYPNRARPTAGEIRLSVSLIILLMAGSTRGGPMAQRQFVKRHNPIMES